MKSWLENQHYPKNLIQDAMQKSMNRDKNLNVPKIEKEKINFITKFNPNNNNIFPAVKSLFNVLKLTDETSDAFKNCEIQKCNKQSKNLKSILTHATFSEVITSPMVKKCNRPRCKTCPSLIEGGSIKMENGLEHKINFDMSCISKNIIYVLFCNSCRKSYIGESSDFLNMRINTHRQQIKDSNLRHLLVSRHIFECNPNVALPFKIMPIYKMHNENPIQRLSVESDLIKKYKPSLNSKG